MCDSDSEEFASADEDFEEIEPDELEEVLESVKPSDVSSKKATQVKQSSTKPDVEPARRSNSGEGAEVMKNNEPECKPPTSSSPPPKAKSEDKETNIKENVQNEPPRKETEEKREKDPPTLTKKEDTPISKPSVALPSSQTIVDAGKTEKPSQLPNPPTEPKNEEPTGDTSSAISSSENDPKTGATADVVKPKKLILKPAKPQVLEEQPKQAKKVEEKKQELQPKVETTEEGWDDFDDDWGDFSVEGEVSGGGGRGKKAPTKPDVPPTAEIKNKPTTKSSFKDVDIDDVEHKLSDFMKHKDDPPLTAVLDRLSINEESKASSGGGQSWGGWKPSWGGAAVSFLSTASKSVASITTNITQVIESGIGVPNPEELARRQAEAEAKLRAEGYLGEESDTPAPAPAPEDRFGFDQLVSGVTQISSKVITGGLDTLEGIGKKTMTILQENDPGLLNKRKLLLGLQPNEGVVLSQVLREAKAKTEERERNLKQVQKHQYKKQLHFETLFDDYHGLVHLEALEMLSKQAALKLEFLMVPLTGRALEDLQETMGEVKELCELPEVDHDDADGRHTADELEAKLKEAIEDLDPSVKVDFSEIVKSWSEYTAWIEDESPALNEDGESRSSQDIFEKAMRALAQTTALCVLRMHKLAEILLISEHHSTATEADVLVQLTTLFCWHLSGVATRFCSVLTQRKDQSAEDEGDSELITNIFLEGSNSNSYIKNAFQLFIPILQLGAA